MKKQLFLASALALVTLASCGGNSNGPKYKPGTPLKVGLICLHDEASTYDNNFIKAFNKAVENSGNKVEKKFIKMNVAESQACADAAKQLVNQGCNIVFTDSFGHDEFLYPTAQKYPNVIFSSATGVLAYNGGVQNYHNAFASIYEGRFLAGVIAGEYLKKKNPDDISKEFNVGYVGAFPYAEVISGYTSWFLGLRYSLNLDNADLGRNAHMKVTFTSSWYDEAAEKIAAETLIADGCILISQHADSMGAPTACGAKGIPNVSYNIDTRDAPGADDTIKKTYLGHSRIDWTKYYETVIDSTYQGRVIDGEKDRNWTGTYAKDDEKSPVKFEYSDDIFDKNVEGKIDPSAIDTAAAGIADGTIKVFDTATFTVDGQKLTTNKVDTDGDGTKDFETVHTDGDKSWVEESEYRSAPYIDFNIDGIEKLS